MPPVVTDHSRTPGCNASPVRHHHAYAPPRQTAQRCHCGHTKWILAIGGVLAPIVACAKCGNTNRTATAYELGYIAGVTAKAQQAAV